MNEIFAVNLSMIQNDLARIESLLPAAVVNAVLGKTEGTLAEDAVVKYKGAHLFYHRNGWLWYALRKTLMPVRMMKRSAFGKSGGLTIRAVVYAVFLTFIWMYILAEPSFRENFFRVLWACVIVGAILPQTVALAALIRNKALYAGVRNTFAGVEYYGEE